MVAVAAQQNVGGGVEGAAHDPAAGTGGQLAGPVEHLLGRAAGKGEQQDRFRLHPLFDQIGHAVDQGASLAAPGAGNDQDGTVTVGGGGILGRIEHLGADGGNGRGLLLVAGGNMLGLHGGFCTTARRTPQWLLTGTAGSG